MKSGLRCTDGQGQRQGVRPTRRQNLGRTYFILFTCFSQHYQGPSNHSPSAEEETEAQSRPSPPQQRGSGLPRPWTHPTAPMGFPLNSILPMTGKHSKKKVLQQTRVPVTSPRTSSSLGSARMPTFFSLSHFLPIPPRCRTFPVSGSHSGTRQRLYRVALEWGPVFWG